MADDERLFAAFPPVSTEQWNKKIREDLDSCDPDELLRWTDPDGLEFCAFYRQEDLGKIPWLDSDPGKFPFVRGAHGNAQNWLVREDLFVRSAEEAGKTALDAIKRGAGSLGIKFSGKEADLSALFKALPLEKIAVNLDAGSATAGYYGELADLAMKPGRETGQLRGSLEYDPVTEFSTAGASGEPIDVWMNDLRELTGRAVKASGFRLITVRGDLYHNRGATILQELAFSLAAGTEYICRLTDSGIEAGRLLPLVQFRFSVGSSYFPEIAKLRAARMLWAQIARAFGAAENACRTFIHCESSLRSQTTYNPYVNMLRGTTQAMSAVIGGTDSLSILPFDHAYRNGNAFSSRLASNIQFILKEESGFAAVADPGGGSYYVENLTHELARRAWELFLEIENEGGLIESAASGRISEMIEESAAKRSVRIARRKEVLLGTNAYPVPGESLPQGFMEDVYTARKDMRAAAALEAFRTETENMASVPTAFMFTYGNPNKRRARADFACSFFACGGFRVIDNPGFETLEEGLTALGNHRAEIVVLCSSDEEYPEMAGNLSKKLEKDVIAVIAGRPGDRAGEFSKAGIDHFIYAGSDILQELKNLKEQIL